MSKSGEKVEVLVGKVGRAHGIRGEVSVILATDEPEKRFASGAKVIVDGTNTVLTVAKTRTNGNKFIVAFNQITDRNGAEALLGLDLLVSVDPDELPSGDEEYYDRQLIGLEVLAVDTGEKLGVVERLEHLPGQDLLVVQTEFGSRMVPFVKQIVVDVDLAAKVVRMVNLPGLIDDSQSEIAD